VSWERELKVLNEAIRRLNAEYDAFLFGGATHPPVESRKHVEEMFRRLSSSPPDAAAERYLFSSLQGRYYTLCERWERLQAEKESGRRPGARGGFAAPVQTGEHAPSRPSSPNVPTAGSVREERTTGPSPERELFDRYIALRRGRGDDVAGIAFEAFRARLREEAQKLKQRTGVANVEFEVTERDGRVKLVARPGKRSGAAGERE
jgi:hypothetical protein